MRINYDFNRYRFLGIDNKFHTIRGCPVLSLQDLQDWLALLDTHINESDPDIYPDFTSLYLDNLSVRSLCYEILSLHEIDLAWLNLDMIVSLIHHTTDSNGNLTPSLLVQINGLNKPKTDKPVDSTEFQVEEYMTNILLDLINTGIAKDYAQARAIASELPADELEALIYNQFNRLKTPEQKKKEKEEQEFAEAKTKFYEQKQAQNMFGASLKKSS